MDITQIKKVYFIGVAGIGVSALVRYFSAHNVDVAGSDLALPPRGVLPEGGTYFEGQSADNVPHDAGLVIYSPAAPKDNPERVRARELNIPELSYPEALAEVTKGRHTIAVSGTHGKSTTTALLGKLFEADGLDASVIVGAEVPGWDHNYHHGSEDMFIVEACEYRRHMMHLTPATIVLTNLELDHPDYYRDLADVKSAFSDYIQKLSSEGLLIMNNDDANIRDIVKQFDGVIVRYGVGSGADLIARNVYQSETQQTFDLVWKGTPIGSYSSPLPGVYNLYNILAAAATLLATGGKADCIQSVLSEFIGVGRRFEIVGECQGRPIISDYAHHPTALRVVADAAQARYRDKKVLVVFRPHHRERTRKLFNEFVQTFLGIPHIIVTEIYDVAGRDNGTSVSAKDLLNEVHTHDPRHDISFAEDLTKAEELVRLRLSQYDAVLVIGAGDADQLARRLVQSTATN
jgi:UDP-N-acetylmuramate--alanine ligase